MPENTQVQARLILRNDTVGNWNAAETEVLMQGEVGIEFQTDMTAKIKIGDGTKPWSQLPYFGGTATKVFQVGALTEIGSGEVSGNAVQRRFTDMQGWMNQYIAANADEVIMMVCGIPVKIKE